MEVLKLETYLLGWVSIGSKLTIQPIIEHPKIFTKIADRLMEHSTVKTCCIFGIHDFQKQWHIKSLQRMD